MEIGDKDGSAADECPNCGAISYRGGYCFQCGAYRPSKRTDTVDLEELDTVDFMERSLGTRLGDLGVTEDQVDEKVRTSQLRQKHKGKRITFEVGQITEINQTASILVQCVVQPYGSTAEGQLVRAIEIPWRAIVACLKNDWTQAFKIPPRVWEEMIAAAFDQDGYDDVILTPRSGDHGRDVVATRKGVGCIRIIDSVKAYKPGHLVRYDDVRSLAGVLHGDQQASKGILTTTSDFAPGIKNDPYLAPLMPYRLELMNGTNLKDWLCRIAK